jgi:hypothetical protein
VFRWVVPRRVLVLVAMEVPRSRGDEWLPIGALLDVGPDRNEEPLRGCGDLRDGGIEGVRVSGRGRAKAAHLANKLAGCRLDLTGGRGNVGNAQGSNASTHAQSVPAGPKRAPLRRRITSRAASVEGPSCNVPVIRAAGQFGMMSTME